MKQEEKTEVKYTDWTDWETKPLPQSAKTEMVRYRYYVKNNQLIQEIEVA